MEEFEEQRKRLIFYLESVGILKSKRVKSALMAVPRDIFVPKKYRGEAYDDTPLPIGHGQTISQPLVVVVMTELLDVRSGHKILEIGAGSGWQAGLLGYLVGPAGKVWSIDRIPELVRFARENLRKAGIKNVDVIEGDGTLGLPGKKFDRIIITAATPKIPNPLVDQLCDGGKIVAPVGNRFEQSMILAKKMGEELVELSRQWGYRFVPLVGKYGFREGV
jgi:protein-L-isoaspartate(D-aspartate) O-methyltransferase